MYNNINLTESKVLLGVNEKDNSYKTGWKLDGDTWYYYNSEGEMETDKWEQGKDGFWYYLDSNGKMATDQYVLDNNKLVKYYVGSDGKWDGEEVSTDYTQGQYPVASVDTNVDGGGAAVTVNQIGGDTKANDSFDIDNLQNLYFADEAKYKPKQVTYSLGGYTYSYELQEHGIAVPFSTELDYGEEFTRPDGTVVSTKMYEYKLVYTDAPQSDYNMSEGIVFVSPSKGVGEAEIPKPLGRGSTGRVEPQSLNEKLAMEEAMSNPSAGKPVPMKKGMTDPRWPGDDGWVKYSQNINGTEVHYVYNTKTGQVDDFKFK